MRIKGVLILLAGFLLIPLTAFTEIVTASSEPFTFPAIDNIQHKKTVISGPMFSSRGHSSVANTITLAWTLPVSIATQKGAITLYSLQGKSLKTFDLKTASGSVTWKVPHTQAQNGILLARLSCGSHASTLKLVLCK